VCFATVKHVHYRETGRAQRSGHHERDPAGKRNGELLQLAATEFDMFLTADRNLPHQQNLSAFDIAVVVIIAKSNRLSDLKPLVPKVLDTLPIARRREATIVSGSY
jgi:hypothetical protein